ncbi:hypothetical protein O6P43_010956 [Quillaja saponaria]|uniref:Uncharacterized protein n=1 Tax=Quillaja saponaria TaxID=32244 RepID=A0AAD7VF22_QUISA|nr:hypothetical protein O6P43_010956 [Quillaja saponaria]
MNIHFKDRKDPRSKTCIYLISDIKSVCIYEAKNRGGGLKGHTFFPRGAFPYQLSPSLTLSVSSPPSQSLQSHPRRFLLSRASPIFFSEGVYSGSKKFKLSYCWWHKRNGFYYRCLFYIPDPSSGTP